VDVFGFAAAMFKTCAFITRYDSEAPRFVGYENNIDLRHGMVLMDATADIDGVTELCPASRTHVVVPPPSYTNLEIIQVQNPYIGKNLKHLLDKGDKARLEYSDWMKSLILDHVALGQKALVVCKKKLIVERNVPDWDRRDARWELPAAYTTNYDWNVEGRHCCVVHWGTGIGDNAWKDADVVLLFGEHIVPRRTAVARSQGLSDLKATEGALGTMKTLNKRTRQVDAIHIGDAQRWMKQMAMRGNGRHFDEHGVCGHQKLVYTGDYEALRANADRLFPGAKITRVGGTADTYAEKFLEVMSRSGLPNSVPTKWIGDQIGAPWRSWSKDVLKRPATQACMQSLGWRYVSKGGRGGGKLLREPIEPWMQITVAMEQATAA
jgi:hypothetical protein